MNLFLNSLKLNLLNFKNFTENFGGKIKLESIPSLNSLNFLHLFVN